MIPQETVNLILDTARIEDVVGDFVALKRRGASLVACCPFHNEKTPSFYVTPSKGIFKCFGCGKSGSAVGFVMEHEHCTYPDALRYIAQKYRIEIQEEELSAEEIASRQRSESLYLVMEFAQRFFVEQLGTPEGQAVAKAYYHSRGLEDETIAKYGLGWAPSGRTTLTDAAIAAGYKMEYLVAAGLTSQHDDGSYTDRFRERVSFPIYSLSGRVIAFSCRTLKSDVPAKYVNSPETEIYVKSRALLGIYHAKADISRLDKCYLVEGNVDVITMQQLGVHNVVASCGTSLTVEQIRIIKKFTSNLTIMYDGDKAGIHAALRGINMVLAEGMNVRIVLLPEGEDPDSFGRSHTLEEVQRYIDTHETDFVSFKTDLLLEQAQGDSYRKAALINDIADTIAEIPDAVQRSVYVEDIAVRFGVESGILFDRVSKTRKIAADNQRKEQERLARRAESASALPPQNPVYEAAYPEKVEAPRTNDIPEENHTVAKAEKDLLYFLIRHGDQPLEFPTDSPYYSGEEGLMSVREFIASAMDSQMLNSVYARVYDAYMNGVEAGMSQQAVVTSMIDSQDRAVAKVVSDLYIDQYQLSVKSLVASMVAISSWLVQYVPKAIIFYAERRVQSQIDDIKKQLAVAPADQQASLMAEFLKMQRVQKEIKKKL